LLATGSGGVPGVDWNWMHNVVLSAQHGVRLANPPADRAAK
jgi:hypothetical protein